MRPLETIPKRRSKRLQKKAWDYGAWSTRAMRADYATTSMRKGLRTRHECYNYAPQLERIYSYTGTSYIPPMISTWKERESNKKQKRASTAAHRCAPAPPRTQHCERPGAADPPAPSAHIECNGRATRSGRTPQLGLAPIFSGRGGTGNPPRA